MVWGTPNALGVKKFNPKRVLKIKESLKKPNGNPGKISKLKNEEFGIKNFGERKPNKEETQPSGPIRDN